MRVLRYFLLLASLAGACFPLYVLDFEKRITPLGHLVLFGLLAALILNFVYVLLCPPEGGKHSRLLNLGRLWLDVKERELRERRGHPPKID